MDDQLIAQPESMVPEGAILEDERASYVEALIRHRAPELTEAEITDAASRKSADLPPDADGPAPVVMVDQQTARHILVALEGLDQRLDAIERLIGGRA
jgi:hypothetical protein